MLLCVLTKINRPYFHICDNCKQGATYAFPKGVIPYPTAGWGKAT